jgi:hypothetical protein
VRLNIRTRRPTRRSQSDAPMGAATGLVRCERGAAGQDAFRRGDCVLAEQPSDSQSVKLLDVNPDFLAAVVIAWMAP